MEINQIKQSPGRSGFVAGVSSSVANEKGGSPEKCRET